MCKKPSCLCEGVTDNNSLPLSDISNSQPTMTTSLSSSGGHLAPTEPSQVNTERPASYQELPSLTGSLRNYCYVDSLPDITRTAPYEQLNADDTQRPASYQQLPSQTGHQHDNHNVGSSSDNRTTPYEQLNTDTQSCRYVPMHFLDR